MSELHFLSVLCPHPPKEHPGAQPPILCLFILFQGDSDGDPGCAGSPGLPGPPGLPGQRGEEVNSGHSPRTWGSQIE